MRNRELEKETVREMSYRELTRDGERVKERLRDRKKEKIERERERDT